MWEYVQRYMRLSRVARTVAALLAAFVLVTLVFWAAGADPFKAYEAFYRGSVGTSFGLRTTTALAGVLILTGLAVAVPARAQLWNIGGEGQLYAGAFGAAWVGLNLHSNAGVTTVVALLSSAAFGAAWGLIAGLLRSLLNANEVLTTLMLNFIAQLLVDMYISHEALSSGIPNATGRLPDGVGMPKGLPFDISSLLILGVIVAIVVHVVVKATRFGLLIRATGLNPFAARNAGINVNAMFAMTMLIGGALAGLAGGVVVVGIQGLLVRNFSPGYGFIGVAIAMLARAKPLWVIVGAIFFGALSVGGSFLQPLVGLSASASLVVQGAFVLSLLALWVLPPGLIGRD